VTTEYCKISLKKLTGSTQKAGYHSVEFKKFFGSTKVVPSLSFTRSELFQESRRYVKGMSISGVQQKLSLKEDDKHRLVATAEGGEYILKPSPEAYPNAAENEHAAMVVSQLMGIDTAQCCLVTFKDGELSYLTKRFDRLKNGNKLNQEDLVQCFDLYSTDKYSKTYEEAGKLINEVTNGKQAVVLDFVRRVILAYIMGDDDFHLKNISVQRLAGNTSPYYDKLTPNYDSLFCDAFKNGETENSGVGYLALGLLHDPEEGDEFFSSLYTHYGYYTGYDFLELGRRLGLKEKPILSYITKLKNNQKKILETIDHSFMPNAMKNRAGNTVKKRIQAMQIVDDRF